MKICVCIAFLRANVGNALKYSILPLLNANDERSIIHMALPLSISAPAPLPSKVFSLTYSASDVFGQMGYKRLAIALNCRYLMRRRDKTNLLVYILKAKFKEFIRRPINATLKPRSKEILELMSKTLEHYRFPTFDLNWINRGFTCDETNRLDRFFGQFLPYLE